MSLPLNPEDLAVESVVIGPEHSQHEELHIDSQVWYTNTRPMPVSNTACTACYA